MTRISFVYFDVGQVLVSMKAGFDEFCVSHNLSSAQKKIFDKVWGEYSDGLCSGAIEANVLNNQLVSQTKATLPDDFDIRKMTVDSFQAIPQTHQLLAQISERFPIGLLSNAYEGMLDGLLKQGKIPQLNYQSIIDSFEAKLIKPDPKIYALATQKAGVPAEEILFIDDNQRNIEAAKKAFWQTYKFDEAKAAIGVREIKALLSLT